MTGITPTRRILDRRVNGVRDRPDIAVTLPRGPRRDSGRRRPGQRRLWRRALSPVAGRAEVVRRSTPSARIRRARYLSVWSRRSRRHRSSRGRLLPRDREAGWVSVESGARARASNRSPHPLVTCDRACDRGCADSALSCAGVGFRTGLDRCAPLSRGSGRAGPTVDACLVGPGRREIWWTGRALSSAGRAVAAVGSGQGAVHDVAVVGDPRDA